MLRRLLVVEDSNEDFEALVRALRRVSARVDVERSISGDDALDMMRMRAATSSRELPEVIILDLNLPGTDGRAVLTELKADRKLRIIPVVVLSTSTNPTDIDACYDRGVSCYCSKSFDRATFEATVAAIDGLWFRAAALPKGAGL